MMDNTGRQRRARRRIRGKSDFAAFDEIALFSDALRGEEISHGASSQGAERLLMLRVLSAWARAVGPHLKAVARPSSCRHGRVMVEVRDTGWKRELERARPEILARMIRLLPDHPIREITFRLKSVLPGGVSAPAPERSPATSLVTDTATPSNGRTIADLPQPAARNGSVELADHLRQVMSRYLARSH